MKTATDTQFYKGVSAAQLFDIFRDSNFYPARCDMLKIDKYDLKQCEPVGQDFIVNLITGFDLSEKNLPSIAKSFLGDDLESNLMTQWKLSEQAPYEATFKIEVDKMPVDMSGSMKLQDAEGGCTNDVVIEVSCSIPFVGKKVEEMLAAQFVKALKKDQKVTQKYIDKSSAA